MPVFGCIGYLPCTISITWNQCVIYRKLFDSKPSKKGIAAVEALPTVKEPVK
ncbi:MAG: hypothetical protein IPN09_08315 [Bacteroidetes bacterium]|nr:hypothetical protein [Bacteroidota bacterium]